MYGLLADEVEVWIRCCSGGAQVREHAGMAEHWLVEKIEVSDLRGSLGEERGTWPTVCRMGAESTNGGE